MNRLGSIAILMILVVCWLVSGQTIDEENNWYKETNRGDNWYTKFDFKRYTQDDVLIAKTKFLRIVGRPGLDEWEGTYHQPVMLGHAELTWSNDDGFVEAYTYHTLAGLNYGGTVNERNTVRFYSEKPSRTSTKWPDKELVKVKFGETHFLIPQKYLRNFAERAAGLTSNRDENDYYWIKTSDENKTVFGVPTYPKRFQRLIRQPIQTRIISIGKPKLRQDKFDNGEVYAEYHERSVIFDSGSGKGIKTDMFLFSDDLNEWIQIVRVNKTRSFGILSRSLAKSKQEVCWVDDSRRETERPCVSLRPGVLARTLSREFNF